MKNLKRCLQALPPRLDPSPHSLFTGCSFRFLDYLRAWNRLAVCGITAVFLIAELNLFYLKFILWIPPPHFLMQARLLLFLCIGAVALNETFHHMDDPTCKRFGQQAWVVSAIEATEVLICVKFGWETLTIPLPFHVAFFWSISFGVYLVWTVWNFWPSIIGGFGTYREVEDNVDKHE
ncbi:phosphatidylserine synthase 2-like [Montipora capricornis]|uniref:phosphatidylserine synthase 2-like n=1 Tax=Montipora capricornis TaxID=246305 RepID=UPI0035F1476B